MRIQLSSPRPSVLVTKKAHGDISGTKRGIIDPLVSKQPREKNSKQNKKLEMKEKVLKTFQQKSYTKNKNIWKKNKIIIIKNYTTN